MSVASEDEVFAFGPGDLRHAQTRLDRHQNKRVVAPPEPGVAIRSGKQSIDFQTREETDERAREALTGDGENTGSVQSGSAAQRQRNERTSE